MSYATKPAMIERFGVTELQQLTDRAMPPLGAIDDGVLDQALVAADAIIDPYLATAGYQVPLASPPQIVSDYACDIARYRLYTAAVPEHVEKRYDDAIKFLTAVSAGKITLGATGASAPKSATVIQFARSPRVFAREADQ